MTTFRRMILATVMMLAAEGAEAKALKVGQPAPDFELTLIDGSKVSLADMKGKVVVLNFWATWCLPCRVELPLLDNYYRKMEAHGLKIFAVTTVDSLPLNRLKKLFEAMTIPSVRKIKGGYADLGGLPTNYVIDRAGVIRYAATGAFDLDELNQTLVPLLREAPPAK